MSRIAQWDNYSVMETAKFEGRAMGLKEGERKGRAEGRAEGRKEGEQKGRADEKIEIARNMKKDGVDPSVIAKYTGLSPAEIEHLN
ncbi:MAG: hypothetical protein FWE95_06320, partial [Planctomycetaceae bacterium]|nr:hypothetical protein [Planctomycetaceae bacterium]